MYTGVRTKILIDQTLLNVHSSGTKPEGRMRRDYEYDVCDFIHIKIGGQFRRVDKQSQPIRIRNYLGTTTWNLLRVPSSSKKESE